MRPLVFTQRRLCIDFGHSFVDPLWVARFSDVPGTVRGFPALAGRSHRSCVNPVGVALNFLPHGRRCVDSARKSGCLIPAQMCIGPVGCASNFQSLH
ncbi:hypothetical protein NDU88_004859 [Pleurodeles waltl]|uniref:Uncharacterized protein n=1 Tax=Pleurodeles waltl TaxID=8319 RepID=A0AAV7QGG7_PLEWA|nr:hypothetical protein NDU88_004859 [Pleurodeles waltl]